MAVWNWRSWFFILSMLGLSVGCIGPGGRINADDGSGPAPGDVRVTIQGTFQKKVLTPTGFSGISTLPTRYCWAELRRTDNSALIASGPLGSDGTGFADVAQGTRFYVRVLSRVQVPTADNRAVVLEGHVKNGPAPASGASNAARESTFTATSDWAMESNDYTADGPRTVALQAMTGGSDLSGGAFNIADQMAAFARKVNDLEPTLQLPDLHVYWTTSNNPAQQARLYPEVLKHANGTVYTESSSDTGTRAVFTAAVFGQQGGAANAETDEFDDGALLEVYSHLLFADRSLVKDGSSSLSLLRRDNDNVYVSRYRQSESTAAFTGGFCDFLAGAVLGDGRLLDSYNDGGGTLQVETFDLSRHDQISAGNRSEFTRGSIAVSLWGIWRNSLGGTSSGLATLWAAVRSNTALSDGTGEFNGATLGCYPSYLVGVKSRLSGSQWTAAVGELGLENVPEPTPTYFNGTALYLPISLSVPVNGAVQTYSPDQGRYYDRNQSQAYRFFQGSSGSRTISMVPGNAQDLLVEVIGNGGVYAQSPNFTDPNKVGQSQTFNSGTLPPGYYVVRVRAGSTTQTGSTGFTLTVQ